MKKYIVEYMKQENKFSTKKVTFANNELEAIGQVALHERDYIIIIMVEEAKK